MKRDNIVILTGAGVSADSGLNTFRAADGLWEDHRIEDVASPQGFARDPELVHRFYDARRERAAAVEPNAAHHALAELEAAWPGEFLLITQNVDTLHERAGSIHLIHMHGQLDKALCTACYNSCDWIGPMDALSLCPTCKLPGMLRPDIVWFGEMPYQMEAIEAALRQCDLFVSIGTSGAVYPAAGFVQTARYAGARTLELNLEPSLGSSLFDDQLYGRATEVVPAWVAEMLA